MILRLNILDNGNSVFLSRTLNSLENQITQQISCEILEYTAFWKTDRNELCGDADYVMFVYSGSVFEENAFAQICQVLEKHNPSWLYFDEQTFDAQINGNFHGFLEKPDFDSLAFVQEVYTGEGVIFSRECLGQMELHYVGSNFVAALTEMSIAAAIQAEPRHIRKVLLTRSQKIPLSQSEKEQLTACLKKYMHLHLKNFEGFPKKDGVGFYIYSVLPPVCKISVIVITDKEVVFSFEKFSHPEVEFEIVSVTGDIPYWKKCVLGASKATHDMLCFLDQDSIECSGDSLISLCCYAGIPEIGIVSPRINGNGYLSTGSFSMSGRQLFISKVYETGINYMGDSIAVRETSIPNWKCWMIQKTHFLEIMNSTVNMLEINDYSSEYFMIECALKSRKLRKKNLFVGIVSVAERTSKININYSGFCKMLTKYPEDLQRDRFCPVRLNSYIRKQGLNYTTYFPTFVQEYSYLKKRILILTHELSLTGAPVVLLHVVHTLLEENYQVVVISPKDGPLRNSFIKENVPVIIRTDIDNSDDWINWANDFDIVLVNTVVCFHQIQQLAKIQKPVMWWLHDAKSGYEEYLQYVLPETVPENVSIYSVSKYADDAMKLFRPQYKSRLLYYGLQDKVSEQTDYSEILKGVNGKKVFINVGTLVRRKGQDILAESIRMLADVVRKQCRFLFIGQCIDSDIFMSIKNLVYDFPEEVQYIESIPHEEIFKLYRQATAVICSSRDDPLPTVMAETMMVSGVCICSENTGTADLIRNGENGFLYGNDDPQQLACCIQAVVENSNLDLLKLEARKTYESYFEIDIFKKNLMECVEESIRHLSEGVCL